LVPLPTVKTVVPQVAQDVVGMASRRIRIELGKQLCGASHLESHTCRASSIVLNRAKGNVIRTDRHTPILRQRMTNVLVYEIVLANRGDALL
jgi:hypothetical protein